MVLLMTVGSLQILTSPLAVLHFSPLHRLIYDEAWTYSSSVNVGHDFINYAGSHERFNDFDISAKGWIPGRFAVRCKDIFPVLRWI